MSKESQEKMGSLEEAAFKRRDRLKNLKRKAEQRNNNDSSIEGYKGNDTVSIPKPIFRNYKPQDETIQNSAIDSIAPPGDIENEVKDQLELIKTPIVIDEIDIANLAPRKPDWDLKRDVSKKLEKLEKRTQRAIAELIRDRLKNNQENILQLVNVGTALNNTDTETNPVIIE